MKRSEKKMNKKDREIEKIMSNLVSFLNKHPNYSLDCGDYGFSIYGSVDEDAKRRVNHYIQYFVNSESESRSLEKTGHRYNLKIERY